MLGKKIVDCEQSIVVTSHATKEIEDVCTQASIHEV